MKELKKLIENCTHQITDENLNKWKVIEVSDLDEIMEEYHQAKLKLLNMQNVSICNCGTEEHSELEKREDGLFYCTKCNKPY